MGIGLFIYLGSRPYSHWPGPALGELRSVVSCISRTERARMAAHASKRLYIVYMMYIQLGCSGALPHCTSRPHFARSMSHRSPQTMRRRHAVVHCKRAARDILELMHAHRTAIAGSSSVAGLSACPATCGRRHKSHKLLCGARLATALGAQQLSMKISVARRLSSSPATRAHPRHSAQAFWAGSKSWHTCCAHALRPRCSESCRFQV